MNTVLATKPASVMRSYTQQVRDHSAAMARIQDQYFAALKRAEAQYFEGVKRITEAITKVTEPTAESIAEPATEPIAEPATDMPPAATSS